MRKAERSQEEGEARASQAGRRQIEAQQGGEPRSGSARQGNEVFTAKGPPSCKWKQGRHLPDRAAGGGRVFQAEEVACMKAQSDIIRFLFWKNSLALVNRFRESSSSQREQVCRVEERALQQQSGLLSPGTRLAPGPQGVLARASDLL